MSENENVTITQQDDQGKDVETEVTIADIAGLDMTGVQEFEGGFEPTPVGVYIFEVKDAELTSIETKNGPRAAVVIKLEAQDCLAVVEGDPADFKNQKHQETVFIQDLAKGVGQVKAIMTNAGFQAQGTLETLLDAFCGHVFKAKTRQRKDPNDSDKIYSNLVVKSIEPVQQAQ